MLSIVESRRDPDSGERDHLLGQHEAGPRPEGYLHQALPGPGQTPYVPNKEDGVTRIQPYAPAWGGGLSN